MKNRHILLLATFLVISLTLVGCEGPRTDWSATDRDREHVAAFVEFDPDPMDDQPVLTYAISSASGNVLSLDLSVPDGYGISPCFLELYTLESPTTAPLELSVKYDSNYITRPSRISVPVGEGEYARKYAIRVILPEDAPGTYRFRVRSYTYFTYGARYEMLSTYAYTTPEITYQAE